MAASSDNQRPVAGGDLSHLDEAGAARMVDVSTKPVSLRRALARGTVHLLPATLQLALAGNAKKGSVFGVARIAGMQAAKQTSSLIPLCHPVPLTSVRIDFETPDDESIEIFAEAVAADRTGVEMEALVAVSVAALTVYDMLKAVERGITIARIRLERKEGGKSGSYVRGEIP